MPIPDYVRRLRAAVGHERLILVGASAVIRDGAERILLIRRRDTGQWALPAGIMDMDEAIANTIVREVLEETGLRIKPVRLIGIYTDPAVQNMTYPHGDQVHVVNAAFECRVLGGQLRPDKDETLDAAYFSLYDLPPIQPAHLMRIQDALSQQREAFFR
jgi:ADP-ribose pyrophosphatase YjhB (NUDIX family)